MDGNQKLIDMGEIETHFADLIQRLAGKSCREVKLAARLVSNQCGDGHACVDLASRAGSPIPDDWLFWSGLKFFPSLHSWRQKLEESGVVGPPGTFSPLILSENNKLYLQRYFLYENRVAEYVRRNGLKVDGSVNHAILQRGLKQLFEVRENGPDWQQIAAIGAVYKPFCVVSGGPGTGKTTTVAKIIALLADQKKGLLFRVALAAPTGKAAARLNDSIRSVDAGQGAEIFDREEVSFCPGTLHRLLNLRPGAREGQLKTNSPLPFELIVVDEASMVDLPLMARLMTAIADDAHLILLGDRQQLASVEPGSVFGDLCPDNILDKFSGSFCSIVHGLTGTKLPSKTDGSSGPALADSVIQLRKNYRFSSDSGIRRVIDAIRSGDGVHALAVFDDNNHQDIIWHDVPPPKQLPEVVSDLAGRGILEPIIGDYDRVSFAALEDSCLLCALRKGPYGVEEINRLIQRILIKKGKVPIGAAIFPGLPLMVIKNDYSLGLFNGDVGLVVNDKTVPEGFSVLFPGGKDGPKKIAPALLPPYEPVFAMTVHKSQGMEFNHVCFMLPDRSSPVLTRELVYTAVSRAREKVEVWGRRDVFIEAVNKRVSRESGLGASLWGEDC